MGTETANHMREELLVAWEDFEFSLTPNYTENDIDYFCIENIGEAANPLKVIAERAIAHIEALEAERDEAIESEKVARKLKDLAFSKAKESHEARDEALKEKSAAVERSLESIAARLLAQSELKALRQSHRDLHRRTQRAESDAYKKAGRWQRKAERWRRECARLIAMGAGDLRKVNRLQNRVRELQRMLNAHYGPNIKTFTVRIDAKAPPPSDD